MQRKFFELRRNDHKKNDLNKRGRGILRGTCDRKRACVIFKQIAIYWIHHNANVTHGAHNSNTSQYSSTCVRTAVFSRAQ